MGYTNIVVETRGAYTRITLNRPEKRNALSLEMMTELLDALRAARSGPSRGVMLAAKGKVFSAGHDFSDVAGRDLEDLRLLLARCAELMHEIQSIPQPVLAVVQGLATAAGCQLVATCDLAVASSNASFATPGGQGGWFCTTPMVALSRAIGRKRSLEMLFTGDPIDARTAAEWGLINRVVHAESLEDEAQVLLERATRGSSLAKSIGKQAYYALIDLAQADAYEQAIEVMAKSALSDDAQEQFRSFLEKREPRFKGS